MRLGLDADFVTRGIAVCGGVGGALMSERPEIAVLAQAQNLLAQTKAAVSRVVERVLLEGARRIKMESQRWKTRLESGQVGNGELQFDLGGLHLKSIRRGAVG